MTTAGPTSRSGATDATSSPSRPVIQWIGASKWVPVCSPSSSTVHAHAGPASSNSLRVRRDSGGVFANGSGRTRTGVDSDSGWGRATTLSDPSARASSTGFEGMGLSLVSEGVGEPVGADRGVDLRVDEQRPGSAPDPVGDRAEVVETADGDGRDTERGRHGGQVGGREADRLCAVTLRAEVVDLRAVR